MSPLARPLSSSAENSLGPAARSHSRETDLTAAVAPAVGHTGLEEVELAGSTFLSSLALLTVDALVALGVVVILNGALVAAVTTLLAGIRAGAVPGKVLDKVLDSVFHFVLKVAVSTYRTGETEGVGDGWRGGGGVTRFCRARHRR